MTSVVGVIEKVPSSPVRGNSIWLTGFRDKLTASLRNRGTMSHVTLAENVLTKYLNLVGNKSLINLVSEFNTLSTFGKPPSPYRPPNCFGGFTQLQIEDTVELIERALKQV